MCYQNVCGGQQRNADEPVQIAAVQIIHACGYIIKYHLLGVAFNFNGTTEVVWCAEFERVYMCMCLSFECQYVGVLEV